MGDLAIILSLTGVALATAAISVFVAERLRLDRILEPLSRALSGRRRHALGGLAGVLILVALILMVTPGAGVGAVAAALCAGVALLAVSAAAPGRASARVIVAARDGADQGVRSEAA